VAAAQESPEVRLERVNKLIELIKEQSYDKKLDPFNLPECVICFEEFSIGAPVRKIPVCQHVFHSKCIDEWFHAKLQDSTHKCPLCNADINYDKVLEAIKDIKNKVTNQVAPLVNGGEN
jgi:hypothetical protein